MATFANLIR